MVAEMDKKSPHHWMPEELPTFCRLAAIRSTSAGLELGTMTRNWSSAQRPRKPAAPNMCFTVCATTCNSAPSGLAAMSSAKVGQLLDPQRHHPKGKMVLVEEGKILAQVGESESMVHGTRRQVEAAVGSQIILITRSVGQEGVFIKAFRRSDYGALPVADRDSADTNRHAVTGAVMEKHLDFCWPGRHGWHRIMGQAEPQWRQSRSLQWERMLS